jgi:hypothetical protein
MVLGSTTLGSRDLINNLGNTGATGPKGDTGYGLTDGDQYISGLKIFNEGISFTNYNKAGTYSINKGISFTYNI